MGEGVDEVDGNAEQETVLAYMRWAEGGKVFRRRSVRISTEMALLTKVFIPWLYSVSPYISHVFMA
jgi:hypothetical protein